MFWLMDLPLDDKIFFPVGSHWNDRQHSQQESITRDVWDRMSLHVGYKLLTKSWETSWICYFLENMVNSVNQVTYQGKLERSCVTLSKVTSLIAIGYFWANIRHREYGFRSQTKCAKIQHIESPVNPRNCPFKLTVPSHWWCCWRAKYQDNPTWTF